MSGQGTTKVQDTGPPPKTQEEWYKRQTAKNPMAGSGYPGAPKSAPSTPATPSTPSTPAKDAPPSK
jgi:hypothetical protein